MQQAAQCQRGVTKMAINFPNSPSNGATHTAAGQTFTYDGTAGVWNPPSEASIAITSDGSTPSLASGITGAEVRTLIGAGGSDQERQL